MVFNFYTGVQNLENLVYCINKTLFNDYKF